MLLTATTCGVYLLQMIYMPLSLKHMTNSIPNGNLSCHY